MQAIVHSIILSFIVDKMHSDVSQEISLPQNIFLLSLSRQYNRSGTHHFRILSARFVNMIDFLCMNGGPEGSRFETLTPAGLEIREREAREEMSDDFWGLVQVGLIIATSEGVLTRLQSVVLNKQSRLIPREVLENESRWLFGAILGFYPL